MLTGTQWTHPIDLAIFVVSKDMYFGKLMRRMKSVSRQHLAIEQPKTTDTLESVTFLSEM
jgi:hypothetical protein